MTHASFMAGKGRRRNERNSCLQVVEGESSSKILRTTLEPQAILLASGGGRRRTGMELPQVAIVVVVVVVSHLFVVEAVVVVLVDVGDSVVEVGKARIAFYFGTLTIFVGL